MNKSNNITREEMWAKQCLSATDIDYAVWERDKSILHQLSKICHNCTFVVDVYKCNYTYASSNFVDLLGYDRAQLAALQVTLSQFIYSLPLEQRNDYSNIYSFRILNARQQYIRVTSRHQVLEQDRNGKAWLVIGNMDISPDQKHSETVDCTVLNLKNGEFFSPSSLLMPSSLNLTNREIEILCISIHTVNIHRQNLLRKLGVQNSIEAIRLGQETGLLS